MNNIYNFYLAIITLAFVASCHQTHNGCDVKTSNDVHEGWFNADEIKAIGYIKTNSSDLYPMPSTKAIHDSLTITEPEFIKNFSSVVKSKESGTSSLLDAHSVKAFHIFVLFKNGKIACLYSSVRNGGAYLSPMYAFDSYGYTNNNLHDLFSTLP